MKIYELKPSNTQNQKSFYGKALIIETDNGEKILQSYTTQVAKIDINGNFVQLWDGRSNTTTRHIKAFRQLYNA